ncbi:hypothetical protein CLIB1423_13S02058 [[Candida] railenensis]|uniref:Uncharacterized protein n=1 Tax=[Candida] railenensis TaxID=45579 RepID=A0A9P0QS27_9ASCO|nr:hypothetical protein CLIB1423_13S02058 [[Candida] railenensis]
MTTVPILKRSAKELYPSIIQSLSDQKTTRYFDNSWTFAQLDEWRNADLPGILKARYDEEGETWLTKDELILLMDWKLAKGKFRPTLPKLIRQNEAAQVESITRSAFKTLLNYLQNKSFPFTDSDKKLYISTVKDATKKASELRGVGPATASLILSLAEPISSLAPPFLSDESFIYFVLEPTRPDTKIKYNLKEYTDEYLPAIFDILDGNNNNKEQSLVELEKGAWSLKFYDMGKIDITADIELPFKVEKDVLFKYIKVEPKSGKVVKEEEDKKRKHVKVESDQVKKRKKN